MEKNYNNNNQPYLRTLSTNTAIDVFCKAVQNFSCFIIFFTHLFGLLSQFCVTFWSLLAKYAKCGKHTSVIYVD